MIREIIKARMTERRVTQTSLCEMLGIVQQNFCAFLIGRRALPISELKRALKFLKLSIGQKGHAYAKWSIDKLDEIIIGRLKSCGFKNRKIAEVVGIDVSTLLRYQKKGSGISLINLEKLMTFCQIEILPIKDK